MPVAQYGTANRDPSSGQRTGHNWHRLWCVQLIPQVWTNWRTKKTDGLPGTMMFLWALCGVPFGVYAVVQNFNIPLQIQPQVFLVLCLVGWVQTLMYHENWATWKASLLGAAMVVIFGGVEAALILTLKPIYEGGNETPMLVVGIVAAILLAAGLLPPYGEIWKRRGRVIGINWVFLTMDWLGAVFSLMALVAQLTFDILGGVLYIICACLELGILISHIIWLLRTRKLRKAAAADGKTFDDAMAEHKAQGIPFKWAERKRNWEGKAEMGDVERADGGINAVVAGSETEMRDGEVLVGRGKEGVRLGASDALVRGRVVSG
ncbi:hypothetical protein B0T25DRAFT_48562 [Lasiosphaeria hispida]|uniref:PQ loop repeat protein n=1 Tax=Lasiosphaeria hispida TaxID=260671 RepID=A0AAJ0HVR6_9PEZI|nr:hypothetical protein B0T25DRAFT_48562 [Lasiosphaeria hispida]